MDAVNRSRHILCRPDGGHAAGFTLLELLVVLAIMGLCVSLIGALARPDDRALLRVEAERLARLLELAADESQLAGRALAWTSAGSGYQFLAANRDAASWSQGSVQWRDLRDNDVLRPRTLPDGMRIRSLRIEGTPASGHMRIEFSPSGPASSYSIEMSMGDARYAVIASAIGEVRVEAAPADARG